VHGAYRKERNKMTLYIYNTLTKKKEKFEPIIKGKVSMYVCGPTVYDSSHIGHARSIIVFDIIAKYLRTSGYNLTYVRNFTDIDDKIINRAKKEGKSTKEIAEKYIKEFYEDMDALNVERPDIEPRATEHIKDIIDFIKSLIDKNAAYEIDGDVYFSVRSFKNYGSLSGRRVDDMEAGARIKIDEKKRDPYDFSLWKPAKEGEPFWESPWGNGRPGWHIECSAMSKKYLGESFDIHGGGKDLIFPHHENEIAQSESGSGKQFVKYWAHNGFVNIDKEKMSKSLGNFLTIKEILKKYKPETLRLFLLSKHYRSPLDFNYQSLDETETSLKKIYSLLKRLEENKINKNGTQGEFFKNFCKAMDDDFNTAKGIGILFNAVRYINKTLDENKVYPSDIKREIKSAYIDIKKIGNILGLLYKTPDEFFEEKKKEALEKKAFDAELIENLIAERNKARKEKNWAKADEIRDKFSKMNITLKDTPEGTKWYAG
jgi:cysteinyl-tRNA synthetase